MYGDAATKENDWAFDYLPKIDRKYSWTQIWDDMYAGHVKGMFAFGMNGVPSVRTRKRTSTRSRRPTGSSSARSIPTRPASSGERPARPPTT